MHATSPKRLGSCFQTTPIIDLESFIHCNCPGDNLSGISDNVVITSVVISSITTVGRCLPTNCSPQ